MESRQTGWIQLILGCMFSGKSEELDRLLKRHRIARESVVVFRPSKDTRKTRCLSDAICVAHATDIPNLVGDARVVGIDEAQFFDEHLVEVVVDLAARGVILYIAGLSGTYEANPWPTIAALCPHASGTTNLSAVCTCCGSQNAIYSQRLTADRTTEVVGDSDVYEARCRKCFVRPPAP